MVPFFLPQSMTSFPLSIPLTTGYHSVRILPLHTIYTTTTLNKTTTKSLVNKNAALEILFIQSLCNIYDGGNGVMHGWHLNVKGKRNLKYAEMEVYSDTEKVRESHICIIGNAM